MEKGKTNLAIKILIFILLSLLLSLIPIKALAADAPSFGVSSSLSECYDGDATTITIKIFNDTGVDIMPTSYYLDGAYYSISSGFLLPGQSLTVTKNYTVYFNGAQSVSYDIHLVYHEDGDYDTHTAWETITISKKALSIITPQPMTVITPQPTYTIMSVITPQPHIDAPTPDLGNMTEVTPTPDSGLGDIWVLTPTPENLPQSTPQPTQYVEEVENEENIQNVVLNEDTSIIYTGEAEGNTQEENAENANTLEDEGANYRIAGVMQNKYTEAIKNTFNGLNTFTKLCIAAIIILIAGYVLLAIKIKKIKKDTEK